VCGCTIGIRSDAPASLPYRFNAHISETFLYAALRFGHESVLIARQPIANTLVDQIGERVSLGISQLERRSSIFEALHTE
jgi:hypothetical protein